jgi:hypothetical protein
MTIAWPLLLAWHFDVCFYEQLSGNSWTKGDTSDGWRVPRWRAARTEWLPPWRVSHVKEATFLGDFGACGVHREEPVFHTTDEDHGKL